MSEYNYLATIQPLSEGDGGGYLVSFPDLPGCIADGATPEEAFHQAEDATAVVTFPLPNPHPAKDIIILLKFIARDRGQIEVN